MSVTKLIKDKSELEWFDLERYKYLEENYSLTGLHHQLLSRSIIYDVYLNRHEWSDTPMAYPIEFRDEADRHWHHIIKTGKANTIYPPFMKVDSSTSYFHKREGDYKTYGDGSYVSAMTYSDVYRLYKNFPEIKENSKHLNYKSPGYCSIDFLATQADMGNRFIHLEVDLGAPEDLLIDEVKKLIQDYKRELITGSCTHTGYLTTEKLINQRIIPYIDLMLWELVNETRIHKRILGLTLFPNGERGERQIYDSIRPNALKAMSPDYLNRLFSLASTNDPDHKKIIDI